MLAINCSRKYNIQQMDVETAFLNSEVLFEVYVEQPLGCVKVPSKVYRSKQSLYGLRESSRNCYNCFDNFIKS